MSDLIFKQFPALNQPEFSSFGFDENENELSEEKIKELQSYEDMLVAVSSSISEVPAPKVDYSCLASDLTAEITQTKAYILEEQTAQALKRSEEMEHLYGGSEQLHETSLQFKKQSAELKRREASLLYKIPGGRALSHFLSPP